MQSSRIAIVGAPLDLGGNECWIAWERFDEFGIGTRYELTIDNGTSRPTNPDMNGPDRYLLLARVNNTNFYMLQRASTNAPWHATGVGQLTGPTGVGKFAGQPMQVGIMVSGFDSGTDVNAGFANYLLDVPSTGALSISPSTNVANNVAIAWPGSPSVQLQSTTNMSTQNWQPVPTGTAIFTNGQFILTQPETPPQFFRLKN